MMARLSERPAPDASFPAVNFNGQRFVPSATERRIASCCIGLQMKQIAVMSPWRDGVLRDCRYLLHDSRDQIYPVVPRHHRVRSSGTACATGAQPGPECLYSERWVRSVKEWRKWADSCDPRPITKPRDMYEPDRHIDKLKLKARNFR